MSSILITNTQLNGTPTDVLIEGNRFTDIGPGLQATADTVIDGSHTAILPGLVNAHTHAAMTLLRGYADDMELHTWLTEHIWPFEAGLTEEDVYAGALLACLEMIKTGTTCFCDMYWHFHGTARAVEEMGLRGDLSAVFIDFGDPDRARDFQEQSFRLLKERERYSERVRFVLGPHAPYTVSRESLDWIKGFAADHGLRIQIHLSETAKEVADSLEQHGRRPVQLLDEMGFLGPEVIAVHAIWLDGEEMDLLAERGVKVVHNPTSNMKLCSGSFAYPDLRSRGVVMGLGTDGCSSNNNLDMFEEMKFAALLAKHDSGDPTVLNADQALELATAGGAEVLGLDAGAIAAGKLADCILVDLTDPQMIPCHHLASNLVYAAHGSCVRTTICNGRVLMRDRVVEGEEEIIARVRETVRRLGR
ncbi:MAG: amidohydrolase [Desulfohalobiaceae bacterium]